MAPIDQSFSLAIRKHPRPPNSPNLTQPHPHTLDSYLASFNMAEPPYKRSRRDDAPRYDARNSKDNRDSRAPAPRDDRNRSYRSRSPEWRDRDRAYGGTASSRAREADTRDRRRDGPRDSRDSKWDDRRDDGRKRDDDRDTRDRRDDRTGSRDDGRGHKRSREDDAPKTRSRSPRRDRSPQRNVKVGNSGFEREDQGLPVRERKARQTTPPTPHLKLELNKPRTNSIERDSRRSSSVAAYDAKAATLYKAEEPASTQKKRKPTAADFMGDVMDEDEEEDDVVEDDEGMAAMQAMMGFGGFGTTKQKKVLGNDVGAVRKEKKTEYRQYMNRVGGFNRPLDEL